MPLTRDYKVNFTSTLMSLIRTSLDIKMISNTDQGDGVATFRDQIQLDKELRQEVQEAWPNLDQKRIALLVPPVAQYKLTVGKIYGSLLIFEHWKALKLRRDNIAKTRPNTGGFGGNPGRGGSGKGHGLSLEPGMPEGMGSRRSSMASIASAIMQKHQSEKNEQNINPDSLQQYSQVQTDINIVQSQNTPMSYHDSGK